jgi:DNA-binding NarL/FixJ family response regulator
MEVIGESDGDTPALPWAGVSQADVVIVGVDRAPHNPMVMLGDVLRRWPQARVIALTAAANRAHLTGLFRAGVHGYVTSQCAFEELLDAVRAVVAGSTYLCSRAMKILLDDSAQGGADRAGLLGIPLTDREATILQLLAEGQTSKEVAALLHLSSKTVDACRRQLMRKLGVDSMAGLVKCAILMEMTTVAPLPVR